MVWVYNLDMFSCEEIKWLQLAQCCLLNVVSQISDHDFSISSQNISYELIFHISTQSRSGYFRITKIYLDTHLSTTQHIIKPFLNSINEFSCNLPHVCSVCVLRECRVSGASIMVLTIVAVHPLSILLSAINPGMLYTALNDRNNMLLL